MTKGIISYSPSSVTLHKGCYVEHRSSVSLIRTPKHLPSCSTWQPEKDDLFLIFREMRNSVFLKFQQIFSMKSLSLIVLHSYLLINSLARGNGATWAHIGGRFRSILPNQLAKPDRIEVVLKDIFFLILLSGI